MKVKVENSKMLCLQNKKMESIMFFQVWCPKITPNGSGIAEGGDYLHNSPSEAQKFDVVQLLISGTSAPLLAIPC
jgi:hypothetical protein